MQNKRGTAFRKREQPAEDDVCGLRRLVEEEAVDGGIECSAPSGWGSHGRSIYENNISDTYAPRAPCARREHAAELSSGTSLAVVASPSDPPAFVGRSSADRWAIVGRLSGDCWASSHAILYPMNQAKCSALARCADPIPKDLRSVTDQTKHRSQESSLFACSLTGISGSAGCPDQAGERRR